MNEGAKEQTTCQEHHWVRMRGSPFTRCSLCGLNQATVAHSFKPGRLKPSRSLRATPRYLPPVCEVCSGAPDDPLHDAPGSR